MSIKIRFLVIFVLINVLIFDCADACKITTKPKETNSMKKLNSVLSNVIDVHNRNKNKIRNKKKPKPFKDQDIFSSNGLWLRLGKRTLNRESKSNAVNTFN